MVCALDPYAFVTFPRSRELELPELRPLATKPPAKGELCFAIMLYSRPKRSKWKPRTVDALPPLHKGARSIFSPNFDLPSIIRDCEKFNRGQLSKAQAGKPFLWAIPVAMICGFDETVRMVDAKGGVE